MEPVARLLGLARGPRRVVVGLFGAPGSGKSTIADNLVRRLDAEHPGIAAYVPMDGFHLSNAQLDRLGLRGRKGALETFDAHGYRALIERIGSDPGHDVYVPDYSRVLHEPVAAGLVVPAGARIVLTEGNYLGLDRPPWDGVRELLAELWQVRVDEALLRDRLVARHQQGGMGPDEALAWFEQVDLPNARRIAAESVAPDLVIDSAGRPGGS